MSRSVSGRTPALTISPFLINLSNIFSIIIAFVHWIKDFGSLVKAWNIDSKDGDAFESIHTHYEYIDADAQPDDTVGNRLLSMLPKSQGKIIIINK